jgi:Family of unknown function (DUF6085)
MTLEELLDLQRAWSLTNVHIVDVGEKNFRLAHTDLERMGGGGLDQCRVHDWLVERAGPPAPIGLYIVTPHVADQYSESFPYEPFDLHRLEPITRR